MVCREPSNSFSDGNGGLLSRAVDTHVDTMTASTVKPLFMAMVGGKVNCMTNVGNGNTIKRLDQTGISSNQVISRHTFHKAF